MSISCTFLERALAVFMLSCYGTGSALLLSSVLRELFYHARSLETIVEIKTFISLVRILIKSCRPLDGLSVVDFLQQPSECIGPGCTLKLNGAEKQFWEMFRAVRDGKGSAAAMVERYSHQFPDEDESFVWIEFCTMMGLKGSLDEFHYEEAGGGRQRG